eukprot:6201615-Pleurochrysis_carterae.AAC.3
MSAYASTNSTPVDQLNEKVDALQQRLQALEQQDQNTHLSLDTFWLIAMSIFIFFMQLGFTMLEAGSVRAKNRMNILLKNLLDSCIGALTYYLFGFSLQYGGTGSFIGGSVDYLALSDIHEVQVDSTPVHLATNPFLRSRVMLDEAGPKYCAKQSCLAGAVEVPGGR